MYAGDHPSDALGRAANRVRRGALSLGAGVGVEARMGAQGERFAVISGGKDVAVLPGPLAAVSRAYGIAGAMSHEQTPGGKRSVSDPGRAARVHELEAEERRNREVIARYSAPQVGMPSDRWEERRHVEAQRQLAAVQRERQKLLRADAVAEAEAGKPGTNWTQVSPGARKKVQPLVAHYGKMAHGFTACVRDNTKRFGQERAERICAVVKDMDKKSTKWHGHKAKEGEAALLVADALESVAAVAGVVGGSGVRALVLRALREAPEAHRDAQSALGEMLLADLAVVRTLGPGGAPFVSLLDDPAVLLAAALRAPGCGAADALGEAWTEAAHPRDMVGQFTEKVRGLKRGESTKLPDGVSVTRQPGAYVIEGGGRSTPATALRGADAAQRALTRSAQSTHPRSLGGKKAYRSLPDFRRAESKNRSGGGTGISRHDQARNVAPANHPDPAEQRKFYEQAKAGKSLHSDGLRAAQAHAVRIGHDDHATKLAAASERKARGGSGKMEPVERASPRGKRSGRRSPAGENRVRSAATARAQQVAQDRHRRIEGERIAKLEKTHVANIRREIESLENQGMSRRAALTQVAAKRGTTAARLSRVLLSRVNEALEPPGLPPLTEHA